MNDISLLVVSKSLDVELSASVTDSMPMENALPVTSATVSNSARARKPEDASLAGDVAASAAPTDPSGSERENALLSALTKDTREASKSNLRTTPRRVVVTPVAKTSRAIFVPRPATAPVVTPSSLRLPAPPSAIRSSDNTAFTLLPRAILAARSDSAPGTRSCSAP